MYERGSVRPHHLSRPTSVLEPHLGNQLPLLVHADVETRLCSADSDSASKSIGLHNELGCQGSYGMDGQYSCDLSVLQLYLSWSKDMSYPRNNCSRGKEQKTQVPAQPICGHIG